MNKSLRLSHHGISDINVLTGCKLTASEGIVGTASFWLLAVYGAMHVTVEILLWVMDRCGKTAGEYGCYNGLAIHRGQERRKTFAGAISF